MSEIQAYFGEYSYSCGSEHPAIIEVKITITELDNKIKKIFV